MGLKSVKRMLLKPHHIAFSGLTILILIGVAWYFYSSRRMEGFDARGTYTNKPKPPSLIIVNSRKDVNNACYGAIIDTPVTTPGGWGWSMREWKCDGRNRIGALTGGYCPYQATNKYGRCFG